MHYLIGRDLDGDGRYEFIQNMANMALTTDPYRALQVSEYDLSSIDMGYLNDYGFYALEANRFQVSLLERLLFRPVARGFRPRVVPPPRHMHRPIPPKPRIHGMMNASRPPRHPAPARLPKAARPAPGRRGPAMGAGPSMGGMSRPGISRKPGGGRGPGGTGRGFGR